MKIGRLELELIEPERIEERLEQLLGLTVAEVHAMLAHAAIADHIGAALMPFLKAAPNRAELAVAIAAAGVAKVRAEVRKLYDELLGIAPPAPPAPQTKRKPRGKVQG